MSGIQRGEVYDVMPDPSVGKEIQKKRPCVVVSSNTVNEFSGLTIVCPITDGVGKKADVIHILIRKGEGGTTKDSIVLCEQVKAVDEGRLVEKRGNLNASIMHKIDVGLRTALSL
ncbi:MAG: type II toxin-antitoxin system PemK/MazF family toxin [Bacteroidota bacterium]